MYPMTLNAILLSMLGERFCAERYVAHSACVIEPGVKDDATATTVWHMSSIVRCPYSPGCSNEHSKPKNDNRALLCSETAPSQHTKAGREQTDL